MIFKDNDKQFDTSSIKKGKNYKRKHTRQIEMAYWRTTTLVAMQILIAIYANVYIEKDVCILIGVTIQQHGP